MMEELGPLLDEERDPVAVPVAGLRITFPQGGGLRAHCFVAELDAVRVVVASRATRRAEHGTLRMSLGAALEELEDAGEDGGGQRKA